MLAFFAEAAAPAFYGSVGYGVDTVSIRPAEFLLIPGSPDAETRRFCARLAGEIRWRSGAPCRVFFATEPIPAIDLTARPAYLVYRLGSDGQAPPAFGFYPLFSEQASSRWGLVLADAPFAATGVVLPGTKWWENLFGGRSGREFAKYFHGYFAPPRLFVSPPDLGLPEPEAEPLQLSGVQLTRILRGYGFSNRRIDVYRFTPSSSGVEPPGLKEELRKRKLVRVEAGNRLSYGSGRERFEVILKPSTGITPESAWLVHQVYHEDAKPTSEMLGKYLAGDPRSFALAGGIGSLDDAKMAGALAAVERLRLSPGERFRILQTLEAPKVRQILGRKVDRYRREVIGELVREPGDPKFVSRCAELYRDNLGREELVKQLGPLFARLSLPAAPDPDGMYRWRYAGRLREWFQAPLFRELDIGGPKPFFWYGGITCNENFYRITSCQQYYGRQIKPSSPAISIRDRFEFTEQGEWRRVEISGPDPKAERQKTLPGEIAVEIEVDLDRERVDILLLHCPGTSAGQVRQSAK